MKKGRKFNVCPYCGEIKEIYSVAIRTMDSELEFKKLCLGCLHKYQADGTAQPFRCDCGNETFFPLYCEGWECPECYKDNKY
jgi:hypothetical protein